MPQVCGERCRPCKGGRICPMVCYRELYCKEDTICQALASFEAQCPLPSGAYLAGINGNNYVVVPFDSNLWGNISTLPPGLKYRCHPCQSSVACPRICIYEVYGTPDDICKALGSKPAISNSSGSSSSLQYI
ncbi:hypothetical protein EV182_001357 [Spiromyces aspiralis]|uniref:Uncharacterized protein n=1 Tax=Spiromyces aspiralis TaxID=68401 RepID=A0ACC1HI26_9FUNG|nr:hypothetical protein EV182_001357 [Spiromyces aspiralis]